MGFNSGFKGLKLGSQQNLPSYLEGGFKAFRTPLVESSWNVMAHGDAREGKWRGNCCPNSFYYFCPTSVSILWRTRGYIHISTCVDNAYELPSLPNKTASETFVHKAGAVRSVGRIFITGGPELAMTGRIGQNVLPSSFQTGSSSNPIYFDIFSSSHSSRRPLLEIW